MEKYTEHRPWGSFERFTFNEISTVKILTVNPHAQLSIQYHNHRDEFWRVVEGDPIIIINGKEHHAKPGDEFFIKRKETHSITGGKVVGKIMEISLGTFDENDIVRVKDIYGRA